MLKVTALLQPATIIEIVLMAYRFTAQLFSAALAALFNWKVIAAGVITGMLAGLVAVFLVSFQL